MPPLEGKEKRGRRDQSLHPWWVGVWEKERTVEKKKVY